MAGVNFAGFGAYAHNCGNSNDESFRNNIAHSVNGVGAVIYPNSQNSHHRTCYEASHFTAYKNTLHGAITYSRTREAIFSNMVLIDNGWNIGMNIG